MVFKKKKKKKKKQKKKRAHNITKMETRFY